jgi:hypothetical protein
MSAQTETTRARQFFGDPPPASQPPAKSATEIPYRAPTPGTPQAAYVDKQAQRAILEAAGRLVTPGHSRQCKTCRTLTVNGGGCPGLILGQGAIHQAATC